jgi:sulfite exporter TauE/SafE
MLATAFLLGLAGSLHCAAMCSPLAFAVTNMKRSVWLNRMMYNSGRIFTYGILGAVASTVGVVLPLENFQFVLSIGMGLLLMLVGIIGISKFRFQLANAFALKLSSWVKARFSVQLKRKGLVSTFLLGSLNGLLPCGLTFIALTACLIAPTMLDGFYFMLIFGAGTLPVMLGFPSVVKFLTNRFRFSFSRVNMMMLILAGTLLIARVYWSHDHPSMITKTPGQEVICE